MTNFTQNYLKGQRFVSSFLIILLFIIFISRFFITDAEREDKNKNRMLIIYEYAIPILIIFLWLNLTLTKRMPREMSILWIIGFVLALFWELPFRLMGDNFLEVKNKKVDKYVPTPLYIISHSIQDSILFMIGIYIAYNILGKDLKVFCNYNYIVLLIFIMWGFAQEFLVELSSNGKLWEYKPSKYNPTVLTIKGQSYTLIPYLTWIIAPIIFWAITVNVMKNSKHCKFN